VPDSYRAGVELEGGFSLNRWIQWGGNATFSQNRIDRFEEFLDNYDTDVFTQERIVYENTDIAFSPSVIASSKLRFRASGFTADVMSRFVSRQYLDNTSSRSRSIDPYFVTDLRLSYATSNLPLVRRATATLLLNNLFNELYESNGYTFGFISGGEVQRFNYYYPQAERHALVQLRLDF